MLSEAGSTVPVYVQVALTFYVGRCPGVGCQVQDRRHAELLLLCAVCPRGLEPHLDLGMEEVDALRGGVHHVGEGGRRALGGRRQQEGGGEGEEEEERQQGGGEVHLSLCRIQRALDYLVQQHSRTWIIGTGRGGGSNFHLTEWYVLRYKKGKKIPNLPRFSINRVPTNRVRLYYLELPPIFYRLVSFFIIIDR